MKAAVTNTPIRRDANRGEEMSTILLTLVGEQQLPNAQKHPKIGEKTKHITWKSLIFTQDRVSRRSRSSSSLQLTLHLSAFASLSSKTLNSHQHAAQKAPTWCSPAYLTAGH